MVVNLFGKIAEMRIKEALLKGKLQNLPGQGKPIELENRNPYETQEERIFRVILQSSGELPIEIVLLKEIEKITEQLNDCEADSQKTILKQKLKDLKFKYEIQKDARSNFINN